jgi:Fe2+ transport system protein FeoA
MLHGGEKMNLSQMKEGQKGRIISVGGEVRLRRRIIEMGIKRGVDFYVEKYAPLKDPLELVVNGSHVSLRVKEAAEITVEPVERGA